MNVAAQDLIDAQQEQIRDLTHQNTVLRAQIIALSKPENNGKVEEHVG